MIDEEGRAAILAPIDDGVGLDGREDDGAAGDLLREVRSQRKALIRQEQSLAMGGTANEDGGTTWETLGEQAQDYLVRYGKDLEPMAVLVEAAVRLDGPKGLADLLSLLAELVETYWDRGLYPVEDDDGVETRFQPLSGLSGGGGDKDGALIQPVRRMALVQAGGETLRFLDKVRSDALLTAAQSGGSDQKAARIEEAETIAGEIDTLVRRLSRRNLEAAAASVGTAEAAWRRTIAFIAERTKPRFPAASRLSGELQAIREWIGILADRLPQEIVAATGSVPDGGDDRAAPATASDGRTGGGFVAGKISRREDALAAITAAADYFGVYEPSSPLGATLREVDRRARMSLHELLVELIPNDSAREDFYWRSGIRPPAAEPVGYEE